MLVPEQKLNTQMFSDKVEKVATRVGFGEGLLEAGENNENIVGLCADLTGSTKMNKFAQKYPNRFVQVGVAEQNLVTVASGMAAMGKIPFTSSYAMFSPGRNWEQIRTTVTYNKVPVKIIGSHAGVSVGPDGGTHQAIEDIALMRVLPRMVVVAPCDAVEAKKATLAIAENGKPSYLRLAREGTPIVTTEDSPFEIGKAEIIWEDDDPEVAIIACGTLVYEALLAAKELSENGKGVIVVNNHTIKPMDEKTILSVAKKVSGIVTVEEHQTAGGMGSAVAELLSNKYPLPIEFVGVEDKYGQSGEPEELIAYYGMDSKSIIKKAQRF